MMPMSVEHISKAVQGELQYGKERPQDIPFATSAVTDSRVVVSGSVFVAIPGERVDGHDYLNAAQEKGAVCAIVEHQVPDCTLPQVVVHDSVHALGLLAKENIALRRATDSDNQPFTIVAITGSVGKTTTKDLLKHLLGMLGPTVSPVGSLNNEIGLPLTSLKVDGQTRFLIAEMGANHVGEIANLTTIAPPDISVVLKVGVAHLGEFGSVERIAQAKSEIIQGLVPHGVSVLNMDDEHVRAMAEIAPGDVIYFGLGTTPDGDHCIEGSDITLDNLDHPHFTITDGQGQAFSTSLGIAGKHNVMNALAAAAVAHHLGMSMEEIARALPDIKQISPHRMAMSEPHTEHGTFTLIDDSFNANPDSMKAGIDGLMAWQAEEEPYHVAVLGAMLELGADEVDLHKGVGAYAAEHGVDAVVAVGSETDPALDALAQAIAQGAQGAQGAQEAPESATPTTAVEVKLVHSAPAALEVLDSLVQRHPKMVVLLKGSHASGLSVLADSLT